MQLIKSYPDMVRLFPPNKNNLISWREPSPETSEKVYRIYHDAGLTGKIVAVHQPLGSAEINSQNYRITLDSGEKLLLRCCRKYPGRERYVQLDKLFKLLQKGGVSTPEIASIESNMAYFEENSLQEKISWVFFKYIDADRYFSGGMAELEEAGQQLGKMHRCLQQHYGTRPVIPMNESDTQSGPFLTSADWIAYFEAIQRLPEKDQYDALVLENSIAIEKMVKFVEENYKLLEDKQDLQNIHFDLNSTNFLAKDQKIVIMDFDNLKVGNVYTDIAFAFHRLIASSIQQGETDVEKLIFAFLKGYQDGNNKSDFSVDKLIVAACNRALWNIRTNLSLKYDKHSKEWLTSLPVNINRLKQVEYLTAAAKTLQQNKSHEPKSILTHLVSTTRMSNNNEISSPLVATVAVALAIAYAIARWTAKSIK